jgi:sterol desaturase/sphingolipid hydroxylase (fatty acid hydroxylase superfamily)
LVRLDLGRPFQGLSGPVRWASWIALPIVAALISEFFYYWFHRAQHAWPFLWRFHRVHHSIREMNAWNSVHHPTEEIFRIPFIAVPLALLGVSLGYIPALVLAILGMQGQFEHSCTRVHLGWFRYLVADNRYHRIHHSTDPRHFGKNFGSFTSVWDQLFGTAHFPARGEWPETGLADYPEARTLRHYVLATAAPRASVGAAHATRPRLDAAAPNR